MAESDNNDLRTLVRDLATRRNSVDRRQLYFALIEAEVWTPVSANSAAAHLQPGDLHPLDREALGGLASFSFFSHQAAAEAWQKAEAEGIALRLERLMFVDLLPLLIDAGAGSAFINPEAKFSGELYRHELETILQGAKTIAARKAMRSAAQSVVETPEPDAPLEEPRPSFWRRMFGWMK
jgi:hypothetical protein